uniref:Uncharacterized protein n=1 Tax=Ditylenchus dipsaci TaxID=166011 RepID=A0A915DMU3_9BILA
MFGSNREPKNASFPDTLDSEVSGPSTSAQSGNPQSKGTSSVFRRQRTNNRPTSSARPWTATQTRSTLADVDSATPHSNQNADKRVTKKAPNAYTKQEDEDTKSLQSSSQNEPDYLVQKPANITFSTDDPQAYSDIEDIGFEDDQVPEVREDVFARPLSAKNRSRQFIHRPSSIKTQRFQRFRHRTKNRRNVSLPENVVLEAEKSGEDLYIKPKQTIEVPEDVETKHLDEAYIPQMDVDLAPQLYKDEKVVQVVQEDPVIKVAFT